MLHQVKKSSRCPDFYVLISRATCLMALSTAFLLLGSITRSQNLSSPSLTNTRARDGSLDTSFPALLSQTFGSPGVSQAVPLPNGKILVAGGFKVADGVFKINLALMNADGTLDNSLGITLSGSDTFDSSTIIRQLLVQPDGKILIGGSFKFANDAVANNIARLNADGTLDTTFNTGTGFNNIVTAIALQQDGKILVGGDFNSCNGVARTYLARLESNGSLDLSFNTTIGTFFAIPINSIVPLPSGQIFIQGKFNTVNSLLRRGLAKLNSDGTTDASFVEAGTYSLFNGMSDFAVRPDGKIYIGGFFEIRDGGNNLICQDLCLVNSNGTLDTSYFVSFQQNNSVDVMYLQSDGRLMIHGIFFTINGISRDRTARLNANGSLDASFNPAFNTGDNGFIKEFVPLASGGYLLPGTLTSVNGTAVENLVRIDATGNVDASFMPHFAALNHRSYASIIQPDGKIIVSGDFNRANGDVHGRIARFNPNGTLDTSFNATIGNDAVTVSTSDNVETIVLQPDGKILLGGSFGRVNGQTRRFMARLNPNGSTDSSFNPVLVFQGSAGDSVRTIALQTDDKMIIGGPFQTVSGVSRKGCARLNPDGSLDNLFVIPFDPTYAPHVEDVLVLPNGKIIIGGDFKFTGNSSILSVAQLNADGSLDPAFIVPADPNATPYYVLSLARQPDGKILLGGSNTSPERPLLSRLNANGSADPGFAPGTIGDGFLSDKINSVIPRPNGKILIAGSFSSVNHNPRAKIARLLENGALDFSFNAPQFGSESPGSTPTIFSLNQAADGNLIVAGYFDRIGTTFVPGFARLRSRNFARQPLFDFDGDGKDDQSVFRPSDSNWYLLRSLNGFTSAQFGAATDKIVPADFDGDGRTDISVFRDGTWYWLNSSTGSFQAVQFGAVGDIPVPADFDGDGKADPAVYRNGNWYVLRSQLGFLSFQFGISTDKPLTADFDGDGKADATVYRDGVWYIQRSQLGFTAIPFGSPTDRPVVGDYDGDGLADQAVYSSGIWYVLGSTQGFYAVPFGIQSDAPVAADFDGDEKTDIAVFRDGTWYWLQSSNNQFQTVQFGTSGDKPIPAAFVP